MNQIIRLLATVAITRLLDNINKRPDVEKPTGPIMSRIENLMLGFVMPDLMDANDDRQPAPPATQPMEPGA